MLPIHNGKLYHFKPYRFCLGVHGSPDKSTKITVTKVCYPKEYLELSREMLRYKETSQEYYNLMQESFKYDYALLKLEKNVERECFPTLCPDLAREGQSVTVCGYCDIRKSR
jgi:hypothetical protein